MFLGLAGCGSAPEKSTKTSDVDRLVSEGRLAEAEAACRKVVQANPEDPLAHGLLAKVLCLRGDAALRDAGFFAKGNREPATGPRFVKAQPLFQDAITEARAALKRDAKLGSVRGTLGLALYRAGQAQKAEEELKAALQDAPDSPEINNTLGLIAYAAGRRDEALTYYESALISNRDMPEANYNLGVLYQEKFEKSGREADRKLALKFFENCRRYTKGGSDAQVEEAVKKLENPAARPGTERGSGGAQ